MQLASLFVKVGMSGGDSLLSSLGKIKTSTTVAGVSLGVLINGFTRLTRQAMETAMALDKYVTFTGKSSQELQKLSFELGQTGVSMGQLQGALQSLEKQRTDMLLGKGYNPAFVLLGIDPRTDPVKMLEQLKDRVGKIADPNIAKSLANQLGISDELYYSLLQNNEAMGEFGKLLMITDGEREGLVKMNKEIQLLFWYIKQIGNKIIAIMSESWLSDVVSMIKNIVSGIANISARISNLVNNNKVLKFALDVLMFPINNLKESLLIVFGIIEDIILFLEGKESLIGHIFDVIGEGFIKLKELAKSLMDWLLKIFDRLTGIVDIWNILKDSKIGQTIISKFENNAEEDRLAPNEANISSVENRTVSVNNYNTFNGYSANELRPELVNLTEKDVSDARMESPELAGNI